MGDTTEDKVEETHQRLVRQCLNTDKVKLWVEPYTTAEGGQGIVPGELAERYSQQLGLPLEIILATMETLRLHALNKLASRETYQKRGIATLKIKLTGKITAQRLKSPLTVQVQLSDTGADLKTEISRLTELSADNLKMICAGRLIEDGASLNQQNIKHEGQVMVIVLTETEVLSQCDHEREEKFQKTREAAQILSKKVEHEDDPSKNYYLQITDQSGKPLDLPHEEHMALTLAMTLHEKGRAALKRRHYPESLLLLLEADKEFSKCNADILSAVDNYAILCLDIVWCYLYLKNIEGLPNADTRLRSCEECFARSYGHDLHRLAAVKGDTSAEVVLFLKLHVLQVVVAYHQQCFDVARDKLNIASRELGEMNVDDEAMMHVVSLGFNEREARLALRSCGSDVGRAAQFILTKREEREKRRKKEKEERRLKLLSRTLGKTALGQWSDAGIYESLVAMGVRRGAAAEAVRGSNNDLNTALELLQTHPEFQFAPDPQFSRDDITQEMLDQIKTMGFDTELAVCALTEAKGMVDKALDQLLQGVPGPSHNTANNASGSTTDVTGQTQDERDNTAIKMIVDDIPSDEDDHLDDDLGDIRTILNEYTALIWSLPPDVHG